MNKWKTLRCWIKGVWQHRHKTDRMIAQLIFSRFLQHPARRAKPRIAWQDTLAWGRLRQTAAVLNLKHCENKIVTKEREFSFFSCLSLHCIIRLRASMSGTMFSLSAKKIMTVLTSHLLKWHLSFSHFSCHYSFSCSVIIQTHIYSPAENDPLQWFIEFIFRQNPEGLPAKTVCL